MAEQRRTKSQETALCPIKGCCSLGLLSLAKELKLNSPTIDAPLLFCRDHFHGMCEMYSIYKRLEDMQFMNLFCDESWWRQIKKENKSLAFLSELHHAAELALSLRKKFQD